jgi:acetyl-CoA carboxylase biotin carboxyl carrier protein
MAKKPTKAATARERPGMADDLAILRELVGLLDSSSATSIRLQRGDASYEVSRGGASPAVYAPVPAAALAPPPAAVAANPGLASAPAPAAAAAAPAVERPSALLEIKSPMVGTFYRSPEPGAEPYVKVGTRVTPGQTLCIIEAMKIMNELESEVTGVIREVLAEDAQPVEFGQVLFRVDPHG